LLHGSRAGSGAKDITTAADVYSLGAILYELLTRRPPVQGKSVLDTLLRVQEEEPARPRTLHRRIDRELESVCLKCLEKDPSRRYGSAEALADDVERWLRSGSVAARPISQIGRLVKWGRRRPATATLLALCLLTGVAVSASSVRQLRARHLLVDDERNFRNYLDAVQGAAGQMELDCIANLKASLTGNDHEYNQARRRARELLDSCPPELRSAEWYCLDSLWKGPAPADPRLQLRLAARAQGRGPPVDDAGTTFVGFSKDGERFFETLRSRLIIRQPSTRRRIVTLKWPLLPSERVLLVDGEQLAWRHGEDWLTINVTRARE
jgi:hypothetical protein